MMLSLKGMSSAIKTLKKSVCDANFATLFGSYSKGRIDKYSDIDILVVSEGIYDKKIIDKNMQKTSQKLGRLIHLNYYTLEDFEKLLKYRDYKIASILEGSSTLVDNIGYSQQLKQLLRKVDQESIIFNETLGFKTLLGALENFRNLERHVNLHPSNFNTFYGRCLQTACIRNSHLALGYLISSQKMRLTGNMTTFEILLKENPLMRKLISVEKKIIKLNNVSIKDTEKCVTKVKSEYFVKDH